LVLVNHNNTSMEVTNHGDRICSIIFNSPNSNDSLLEQDNNELVKSEFLPFKTTSKLLIVILYIIYN